MITLEKVPSEGPPGDAAKSGNHKLYSAGTLRYTLRGLIFLFIWLLWGDFAFTFFESIFTRFIPLYLKSLHASNALIGIMTGSFAGLVNVFFLPNISQWSDGYRSPIGRRIPLLYLFAPLTVISLVAIGFTPEVVGWIRRDLFLGFIPENTLILPLLCVLVVSYHFSNMVLVNAYNWLLRDVVPLDLMARFLSWFRVTSTISSCAFLWFVFPYVISYRQVVCLSVGGFYLVSFFLMCRNVREGDYPPSPVHEAQPTILGTFLLYFRDCLSVPLYRSFFAVYVLALSATVCAAPFNILFSRETLGLSMDHLGKMFALGAAISAITFLPIGWLCDKYPPMIVVITSLVGLCLGSILACFFVQGQLSLLLYTGLIALPNVGWTLSCMATTMKLFPKEKFGQFSSGLNVFGCGGLIFGNYLIGQFIDLFHGEYRLAYFWSALLYLLAIFPMISVYRGWKRHGGPDHYVPPAHR